MTEVKGTLNDVDWYLVTKYLQNNVIKEEMQILKKHKKELHKCNKNTLKQHKKRLKNLTTNTY